MLSLLTQSRGIGVLVAWILNIWGTADLVNAFYQANSAGLLVGQLGPRHSDFVMPMLLITHGVMFRILLQHQSETAARESRVLA